MLAYLSDTWSARMRACTLKGESTGCISSITPEWFQRKKSPWLQKFQSEEQMLYSQFVSQGMIIPQETHPVSISSQRDNRLLVLFWTQMLLPN